MERNVGFQLLVLAVLVLASCELADAQGALAPDVDGNFRAASISWRVIEGNTVEIYLQTEWKRSYDGYTEPKTGQFKLGPTQAVTGDLVRITGLIPPRLFFGDDKFIFLDVFVTSYSAAQDWFRGNTTLRHTYPTANLGGWKVEITGCCRVAEVMNNGGLSFSLSTNVDTIRRHELPTLSSPLASSISLIYNNLPAAAIERCSLDGESQGLPGVCTRLEYVNRDTCLSGMLPGLPEADPDVFVSLIETNPVFETAATSGAPTFGNTQAHALQVFPPAPLTCDIAQRKIPACKDSNSVCCHRVSTNCDPSSAAFCTPTAGGNHAKAFYSEVPDGFEVLPRVTSDGVVRLPCSSSSGATSGLCIALGLHTVRVQVTDGRVYAARIIRPGNGCDPTPEEGRDLASTCPTPTDCVRSQDGHAQPRIRYHVSNGQVSRVTVLSEGTEYLNPPLLKVPASAGCSEEPVIESVMLLAQSDLLLQVQARHYCVGPDGARVGCVPQVLGQYSKVPEGLSFQGIPLPHFLPASFPGQGLSFVPGGGRGGGNGSNLSAQRMREQDARLVPSGKRMQQTGVGHAIAYEGYPLQLEYHAVTNWCQTPEGDLATSVFGNLTCSADAPGTVSIGFGPLPTHNIFFASHQSGAITDMLITFDNPFAAVRPGHQAPVGYLQRNFNNNPQAAEAARLGFTRIDYNLNRGAGGADVSLWLRRANSHPEVPAAASPPSAITGLSLSTNRDEEQLLAHKGFQRLDGNLNMEAGGDQVYIWFQRASGHVGYHDQLPQDLGLANPITDITFTSSLDQATGLSELWEQVHSISGRTGSLNSGLAAAPHIYLHQKREPQRRLHLTLTWTPCACDVGTRVICAYPMEGSLAIHDPVPVRGPNWCTSIHVLAAQPPVFTSPSPQDQAVITFYIGQEQQIPLSALASSPAQQFDWVVEGLPAGAVVADETSQVCEEAGCWERRKSLRWAPAWNQGGLFVPVCVSFRTLGNSCGPQSQGPESGPPRCYTMVAERCVYALQQSQMLQDIAALYSTTWLDLYALNPSITTPDRLITEGLLINVGHLYSVVPGDTLHRISQRFGCSVQELLDMNADIGSTNADRIRANQVICVKPGSCLTNLEPHRGR